MAQKYWFRPKKYGFGFYPICWEGWLMTVLFACLILLSGFLNGVFSEGAGLGSALGFLLDAVILAAVGTLYFERKMKEELKWRWMKKKRK